MLRAHLSYLGTVGFILATAACASTGAAPRPFPVPGVKVPGTTPATPRRVRAGREETPTARTSNGAYALVGTALDLRGAPYRSGGVDPLGFDCSGFTQYVFAKHGVVLPREVREQFRLGQKVALDAVVPGDLIFFTTTAPGASHVAIALGGDQFVHAPSSTGVVRVEHFNSKYWSPRLLGIRRVTAD